MHGQPTKAVMTGIVKINVTLFSYVNKEVIPPKDLRRVKITHFNKWETFTEYFICNKRKLKTLWREIKGFKMDKTFQTFFGN